MKLLHLFIFLLFTIAVFPQYIEDPSTAPTDQLRVSESLIKDIIQGKYNNEYVDIVGTVDHWSDKPVGRTTSEYVLENVFGDIIPVRTSEALPKKDIELRIRGYVNTEYNEFGGEIKFITETQRTILTPVVPDNKDLEAQRERERQRQEELARQREEEERRKKEAESDNTIMIILIVAAGLVLIGGVALAIYYIKTGGTTGGKTTGGKTTGGGTTGGGTTGGGTTGGGGGLEPRDLPKPTGVVGKTVKMQTPPPGTLKLLPGRLKVLQGESELTDVRFFRTSQQKDLEFTIGRNPGEAYKHIQIDQPTVSSDQGRLIYDGSGWSIQNRADPDRSNATVINGKTMGMNEIHKLNVGDKIEFGVVIFEYQAK